MNEVDAKQLKELMDKEAVIVVDVREQDEYNEAHIEGVKLIPMSAFNPNDVPEIADGQKLI